MSAGCPRWPGANQLVVDVGAADVAGVDTTDGFFSVSGLGVRLTVALGARQPGRRW